MGGLHRSWKLTIDNKHCRQQGPSPNIVKTMNIDVRIVAHQAAVIGDQFYWAAGMLETTRRQLRSINMTMLQHSTTRPLASPRPDTDAGTVTYQPHCPHIPACPVCPRCLASVSTSSGPGPGWHHITSAAPPSQPRVQHIPLLQCPADKYRTSC